MNIVCTGKPGDGLLRYSYEHCCYLNSVGIKSQVVIIPNPKHTKEESPQSIAPACFICWGNQQINQQIHPLY